MRSLLMCFPNLESSVLRKTFVLPRALSIGGRRLRSDLSCKRRSGRRAQKEGGESGYSRFERKHEQTGKLAGGRGFETSIQKEMLQRLGKGSASSTRQQSDVITNQLGGHAMNDRSPNTTYTFHQSDTVKNSGRITPITKTLERAFYLSQ